MDGFQGFQEEYGVDIAALGRLRTRAGRPPVLWAGPSVTTTLPGIARTSGTGGTASRSGQTSFTSVAPGGVAVTPETLFRIGSTTKPMVAAMIMRLVDMGKLDLDRPVREYLEMLVDAGAKLYACKMSVDMMGLKKEDFVDGVIDIITASDFIEMTEGERTRFTGVPEWPCAPRTGRAFSVE